MNRRRIVYPVAVLVLAGIVVLGERWLNDDKPAHRRDAPEPTEPYVPRGPNEPPATMSPASPAPKGKPAASPDAKPNAPPIGRPPDVPPAPDAPAMQGTLQVEPTPGPATNR